MLDTLGGLYELVRLAALSRFRLRGPYWAWRMHTAFGSSKPERSAALGAILDYSRWVFRTRRGR